jgi:hypothetical protein
MALIDADTAFICLDYTAQDGSQQTFKGSVRKAALIFPPGLYDAANDRGEPMPLLIFNKDTWRLWDRTPEGHLHDLSTPDEDPEKRLTALTVGGLWELLYGLMLEGVNPQSVVLTPRDPEVNGFVTLCAPGGAGKIEHDRVWVTVDSVDDDLELAVQEATTATMFAALHDVSWKE